jgi:hypothetical protein
MTRGPPFRSPPRSDVAKSAECLAIYSTFEGYEFGPIGNFLARH